MTETIGCSVVTSVCAAVVGCVGGDVSCSVTNGVVTPTKVRRGALVVGSVAADDEA